MTEKVEWFFVYLLSHYALFLSQLVEDASDHKVLKSLSLNP